MFCRTNSSKNRVRSGAGQRRCATLCDLSEFDLFFYLGHIKPHPKGLMGSPESFEVMPLSWTNEMAQMQPLGWQQAWSHQMEAVLLAANTRSSSCSGSGIYVQGEAKAIAYDLRPTSADDQLVVAKARV